MTRFASLLLSCSCNLATADRAGSGSPGPEDRAPQADIARSSITRRLCTHLLPQQRVSYVHALPHSKFRCAWFRLSLCVILVVLPGSLTRWEWRSYRSRMRISSGISAKCSVPHLEVRTAPAPLPAYFCIVCRYHMPHLYAGIQVRQNTNCRCRKNIFCCHFYYGCWYWCC